MKTEGNQPRNLDISTLPEGMQIIWQADFLMPYGLINFIYDARNPRQGRLADKGPFFATKQPITQPCQILVPSCQTLTELEREVYQRIWTGNAQCFREILMRTALDGPLPSQGLADAIRAQTRAITNTRTPREYFESVGKYFRNPIGFP
jgi:hypothetical protein